MTEIILSFSPQVFPSLLTGKKHFEYRSRLPQGQLRAYLYLSSPIKQLVDYLELGDRFDLSDLLVQSPSEELNKRLERLMSEGSRLALPILTLALFEQPISLSQARELSSFHAPQGFCYAKRYPELQQILATRPATVTAINPSQSRELLGWYSQELLAKYPQTITMPPGLLCYFQKKRFE